MKIAAFNVENLFDRPRAFNLEDEKKGGEISDAVSELNGLINKPVYAEADKVRMIELIQFLKLTQTNPPYAIFRKIRGAFWRQPKSGPMQIVAKGRHDWVGWVELRTEPNNAVAVMNTGRVIKEVNADVLAVIEAEHRVALKQFSEQVLVKLEGVPYDQIMLIDGNDDRGIDVGLMTRKGYSVGLMRSHIHDLRTNGEKVYSRDCPEYAVSTPGGETIWILPNHFKSKYGGNDPTSVAKRRDQAKQTAEIYRRLVREGHDKVVILGDLNDTPDSEPLQVLLAETDLKDVSEHPSFDTGEFAGKGTYGLGNDNQKIDYLLLSPLLFARVTASGLFRKGAWPGVRPRPRWSVFPELEKEIHAASDHHVIWAEIGN
jgi:endonuclease/exonuclease/phosphatase family metal-dependent hydrolase